MTGGRRFRILCVVDDCTRECLALIADTSLSGVIVGRARRPRAGRHHGLARRKPAAIVSDYVLRAEGDRIGGQSFSVREHALAA
jgi:putative transposase